MPDRVERGRLVRKFAGMWAATEFGGARVVTYSGLIGVASGCDSQNRATLPDVHRAFRRSTVTECGAKL